MSESAASPTAAADSSQPAAGSAPKVGWLANMANKVSKQAAAAKEKMHRKHDSADDLAAQVELSRADGNIWSTLLRGDKEAVTRIVNADPSQAMARGAVGEIPLHMAFLYNSPKHQEIAVMLMERFPECILAQYHSPLYEGENVLHIAIVNRQLDMIKYLVEREPKLLSQTATGGFFSQGQPCYFGEFPLSFAACTNQKTIVEYLVQKGADLEAVDSNGNNILHLCVIHDMQEMYEFVLNLWLKQKEARKSKSAAASSAQSAEDAAVAEPPLNKRRNAAHFTPFTLAAELGKQAMLEFLLESQKVAQWSYGHVSCVLYPLDELDPLPNPNDSEFRGACQIIVDNANLDMLSIPRVMSLLDTKWDRFAARPFFNRFISTLIFIVIFAFAVILKSDKKCRQGSNAEGADDETIAAQIAACVADNWASNRFRQLCEVFVLLGTTYKAMLEGREIMNSGFEYFGGSGSGFVENSMALSFCICIYTAVLLRMFGSESEDIAVAIGSLVAWMYLLFFLLGFRLTGPFIVMLYRMLVLDVSRFSVLVIVFFLGFSQALYVIFDDDGFLPFFARIKALFLAMLGDFDFDEYADSRFPAIAVTLLVVFVVVVTIMLLNILIAMMGETYGKVADEADKQWSLERARIMFSIQNEMTVHEMQAKEYRYWTDVDSNRFLQVITSNENFYPAETPEQTIESRVRLGMAPRKRALLPIGEAKTE